LPVKVFMIQAQCRLSKHFMNVTYRHIKIS
jgi:hypothetical protein